MSGVKFENTVPQEKKSKKAQARCEVLFQVILVLKHHIIGWKLSL